MNRERTSGRHISNVEKKNLYTLWDRGMSKKHISQMYGISEREVNHIIKGMERLNYGGRYRG